MYPFARMCHKKAKETACRMNRCMQILLFITLSSFIFLVITYEVSEIHGSFLLGRRRQLKSVFHDVNRKRVFTFHNVCLERNPPGVSRSVESRMKERSFVEALRIVVYNATENKREKISVAGSANTKWNFWEISRNTSQMPADRTFYRDKAAFFVAFTCPGNLHHFFEDEFRPLQSLVAATHRLDSRVPNRLLYRIPPNGDCHDVKRFEAILMTLNFEREHDAYSRMPANVCFQYGIFGMADFSTSKRQAPEFVINKFGIDYEKCPDDTVTIIIRKTRRILNMNGLINATVVEGFHNVQAIIMEDLAVEDQLRTAACTRILVGVKGAGLQWAVFMRPKSTLIEIAWPQKYWNFYYVHFVRKYDIIHRGVRANKVYVNWTVYENKVRQGRSVPTREREILMKKPPKRPSFDNIWKWADVSVDINNYRSVLSKIRRNKR